MVLGLTANLLGQAILGEAEAYITTDHKGFYEGILEQEEYEQQFKQGWISCPNYRDDPYFEKNQTKTFPGSPPILRATAQPLVHNECLGTLSGLSSGLYLPLNYNNFIY